MNGVAHGLHGLALDAHRRGELERAARLMVRSLRCEAAAHRRKGAAGGAHARAVAAR
jgi:hypothetical protein